MLDTFKAYITSSGDTILGVLKSETLVEVRIENPMKVVVEKNPEGKWVVGLKFLYPRELHENVNEPRTITFDRNYLIGTTHINNFNPSIISMYRQMNGDLNTFKEIKL
jgi:hypothetical protein